MWLRLFCDGTAARQPCIRVTAHESRLKSPLTRGRATRLRLSLGTNNLVPTSAFAKAAPLGLSRWGRARG